MRIELREVVKKFRSMYALDRVSMVIDPGQVVAVLGANGAGKTTLLRALAGIVAPDSGEVLYDGEKFTRDRLDLRRRFMFLPDFPPVFEKWTPLQHLGMSLRLYGVEGPEVEDRAVSVLRELDVLPLVKSPFYMLSRGQRYKAALAVMFAVNPEVWILDEPFASGMDPQGINVFKRRARAAVAEGRTILYTTQILDAAERFSDSICVIHRGERRALFRTVELREEGRTESAVLNELFQQLREEDTR